MTKSIPYGRQDIRDQDIDAVAEVLRADFLTQGPKIREFEEKFASYIGVDYAIAVANGTAALHLSALALNVQEGQKVLTSPITFSASANCISYCHGSIEFVDIDPDTYLIDLDKLESLLQKDSESYVGVIPVDFAGRAVDLERLRRIADNYGLWVLEDACHAPGGSFVGESGTSYACGSGEFADLSIFSFHPVKHIACGEGGMITTNSKELYHKLSSLRTHGITRDDQLYANGIAMAYGTDHQAAKEYPGWYMELQDLGYNYRLTDIQAALGISQLSRAEEGLSKRQAIARIYHEEFADCSFIAGQSGVVEGHAYHLYVIEVKDRAGLYTYLRGKGIYAQVHYIPVHIMPYYQRKGWKFGQMPNAERYYSRCLSLPMYPTLTSEEQQFVIRSVKEYYNG